MSTTIGLRYRSHVEDIAQEFGNFHQCPSIMRAPAIRVFGALDAVVASNGMYVPTDDLRIAATELKLVDCGQLTKVRVLLVRLAEVMCGAKNPTEEVNAFLYDLVQILAKLRKELRIVRNESRSISH